MIVPATSNHDNNDHLNDDHLNDDPHRCHDDDHDHFSNHQAPERAQTKDHQAAKTYD